MNPKKFCIYSQYKYICIYMHGYIDIHIKYTKVYAISICICKKKNIFFWFK